MDGALQPGRLIRLAALVVVLVGMHLARDVLVPLALAVLVSFLLAPIVSRLEHWRLPRTPSVLAVVLLVFAATGSLAWMAAGRVTDLSNHLPEYQRHLHEKVAGLRQMLAGPFEQASNTVEEIGRDLAGPDAAEDADTVRIAGAESTVSQIVQSVLGRVFTVVFGAGLVLIFVVVMLLRREDLRDRVIHLVSGRGLHVSTQVLSEASRRVTAYLLALALINGMYGITVGAGLALIGVPGAVMWGLLAALLRFVPYVGPFAAGALPLFLSIAAFDGWMAPLLTLALFVTVELITVYVIEPWLFSARTGVSPLALLVAALFWTLIWGPVGLLLSTPLTVCLAVAGKFVPKLGILNVLLGDKHVLEPPARLYQRLIAEDLDEAWDQVAPALASGGLIEVGDTLLIPALVMAEHDRRSGSIDPRTETRLSEGVQALLAQAGEHAAAPAATPGSPVLVLPAHGKADHLAALWLGKILEQDGVQAEVAGTSVLVSEMVERVASLRPRMVCVSEVPPAGFAHARNLCRRLRARFPDLPLVVGLWSLDLEESNAAERLPSGDGLRLVSSMAQARALVLQQAALIPAATPA